MHYKHNSFPLKSYIKKLQFFIGLCPCFKKQNNCFALYAAINGPLIHPVSISIHITNGDKTTSFFHGNHNSNRIVPSQQQHLQNQQQQHLLKHSINNRNNNHFYRALTTPTTTAIVTLQQEHYQ